nr:unnamed protein product [Callosobruchus analis]
MIRDSTCSSDKEHGYASIDTSVTGGCGAEIRAGEITPPPMSKNEEHEAALTPTDVHDVHF